LPHLLEPGQIINAGAADDAEHSLGHEHALTRADIPWADAA
jgi:hypothetical protein